jgi:ribosomal protein S18 acetylase RimI-like enzyme
MNFDNNDAVYVRELGIDDIAPVYHLGEELFTSDLYPYLYRTWDEWEVIGLYNTDPEYCLVAEIDSELAGFILGTIITKANLAYGYILWLGVSPRLQRRGVADKLVDIAIARMIEDGARFMLVDTDPANTSALKFFNRKGFGNTREHIFLSMNLSQHEHYGRLIEYEYQKAERAGYRRVAAQRSRRAPTIRAGKSDAAANEVVLSPLVNEIEEGNRE